jgi:hypothetical protein
MFLDATTQAALVRSGEVSPDELVEQATSRIEKLNPELNAVVIPLFEKACAEAQAAPRRPVSGRPLPAESPRARLQRRPHVQQHRRGEGVPLSRRPRLVVRGEDARRWIRPDR